MILILIHSLQLAHNPVFCVLRILLVLFDVLASLCNSDVKKTAVCERVTSRCYTEICSNVVSENVMVKTLWEQVSL